MNSVVFPDFNNCILNISATLSKYLGVDNDLPKLKILEDQLAKNYRNVVLILVDGLGSNILEKNLPINSVLRTAKVQDLTSVFPSTTTNATTTVLSAKYPAQHGWLAWALNFGESTIELYRNTDYYTGEIIKEDNFAWKHLPFTCFFDLKKVTTPVYINTPIKINLGSKTKNKFIFQDMPEMFANLDKICKIQGKKFVYSYYSNLDSVMHGFGTKCKQSKQLLIELDKNIAELSKNNSDTLFVITADHGQVNVGGFINIYKDKKVMRCLAANLSLESRAAAFKIKPNMHAEFVKAFSKYKKDFVLYSSEELINYGVFGKFENENYKKMLGDFIAVGTTTNKLLIFADGKQLHQDKAYKGTHTGPTAGEMTVPLILVTANKI